MFGEGEKVETAATVKSDRPIPLHDRGQPRALTRIPGLGAHVVHPAGGKSDLVHRLIRWD
jgi:hypothetical protein